MESNGEYMGSVASLGRGTRLVVRCSRISLMKVLGPWAMNDGLDRAGGDGSGGWENGCAGDLLED